MLDQGISVALWAASPRSSGGSARCCGWSLNSGERDLIERIVNAAVPDPVGPEFMALCNASNCPIYTDYLMKLGFIGEAVALDKLDRSAIGGLATQDAGDRQVTATSLMSSAV